MEVWTNGLFYRKVTYLIILGEYKCSKTNMVTGNSAIKVRRVNVTARCLNY